MDGLYESILVYIITHHYQYLSILLLLLFLTRTRKLRNAYFVRCPPLARARKQETRFEIYQIDISKRVCEYLRAAAAAYLNQPIHAIRGARALENNTQQRA